MASIEKASEQLMFVSGYVYKLLRRESKRLGLRWTAILVLKDLDLLGPQSQQALAEIEQVRKPTMTVLLQQMEEIGWIRRTVDPANRRANVVRITAAGRRALRSAGRQLARRLQAALAGLPARELEMLEAGLGPLAGFWLGGIRGEQ